MHTVTLPDATTKFTLPTRWGEVALGQAARLFELPEGGDVYNLLSVFLNLAPVEVMNLPAAFVNEQVLPWLEFLTQSGPDLAALPVPRTITLPGDGRFDAREFDVVPALDITSFGQATDLGGLLQDAEIPMARKRLLALAILFYPAYHGTGYDADDKDRFAEQVCNGATLEQALPITDFFLRITAASAEESAANSSASPSMSTSAPQALSSSSVTGMRWLWSTRWPMVTKPSGLTSSTSPGAK